MWTDSTTVLQWIRNNNKKQPVFEANILAEILDFRTVYQWIHVKGVKNPAGLGTRGISYPELIASDWLQGPLWLKDEDWTSHIDQKLTNEHQKLDDFFDVVTNSEAQAFLGALVSKPIDWERFSQFNRLKFLVMRFLKLLPKCRNSTLVDNLKLAELKNCLLVQHDCFSTEVISLKKTMIVHCKSNVTGLLPLLDSDGTMRAKGRHAKQMCSIRQNTPSFCTVNTGQ